MTQTLTKGRTQQPPLGDDDLRSLHRYRSVVDNAVDGVWSFDLTGVTTYANQRMADLLGATLSDLQGTSIFAYVHPTDLSAARDLFARWLSGERMRMEFRFCRADESLLHAMIGSSSSGEAIMSAGEMTLIVSDITELKLAQAQVTAAYNRERRIADALQRALLKMPARDAFKNVVVDSLYRSASSEAELGGDFCDVIGLGRSRIGLVLGDVVGKGLPAAVQTAELKFTVRTLLRGASLPESVLSQLNAILCDPARCFNPEESLVGLLLAIMNTTTGEVKLASAGSELPAVVTDHGVVRTIDVGGLPLGADPRAVYEGTHLTLATDETLLMLTDGITESRHFGLLFGWHGVAEVLREPGRRKDGRDMLGQILCAAIRHAGGRLQDDACLLSARRRT